MLPTVMHINHQSKHESFTGEGKGEKFSYENFHTHAKIAKISQ